jgi:hypothetical protein
MILLAYKDLKLYQCMQRDQVVITMLREMYIVADW